MAGPSRQCSSYQAADKDPSAETHLRWGPPRSRGTATYGPSTSRTCTQPADGYLVPICWVTPPCIWAFLSSLGENGFFSILLGKSRVPARGGWPSAESRVSGKESRGASP